MAAYDDLNTKRIFTVGIISIVVTAVTALAVNVLYYALVTYQQQETASESDYRRQNAILAEQNTEVSQYGVDPETGKIVIPVNEAMKMIVNESQDQQDNADASTDAQT